MRKTLGLLTVALLSLYSCGGGSSSSVSSDTTTKSVGGTATASVVKDAKVCLEDENGNIVKTADGKDACDDTDAQGIFLIENIPASVNLENSYLSLYAEDENGDEIKIATANYEEVKKITAELLGSDPENTNVLNLNPLSLAEGDEDLADDIGAAIHALAGDPTGTAQVLDFSEVDIEQVVDESGNPVNLQEVPLEELIQERKEIRVKVEHKEKGVIEVEVDPEEEQIVAYIDTDGDGEHEEIAPVQYNLEEQQQEWQEHLEEVSDLVEVIVEEGPEPEVEVEETETTSAEELLNKVIEFLKENDGKCIAFYDSESYGETCELVVNPDNPQEFKLVNCSNPNDNDSEYEKVYIKDGEVVIDDGEISARIIKVEDNKVFYVAESAEGGEPIYGFFKITDTCKPPAVEEESDTNEITSEDEIQEQVETQIEENTQELQEQEEGAVMEEAEPTAETDAEKLFNQLIEFLKANDGKCIAFYDSESYGETCELVVNPDNPQEFKLVNCSNPNDNDSEYEKVYIKDGKVVIDDGETLAEIIKIEDNKVFYVAESAEGGEPIEGYFTLADTCKPPAETTLEGLFPSASDIAKVWNFFENNEGKTVKTSDGGSCLISYAQDKDGAFVLTLDNCQNTSVENGSYSLYIDTYKDKLLIELPDGKDKVIAYSDETSVCTDEVCLYSNSEPSQSEISGLMDKVWVGLKIDTENKQLIPEHCLWFNSDGSVKAKDIETGEEDVVGTYSLENNIIKYNSNDPEFVVSTRVFKIVEAGGTTYIGAHEFFTDDENLAAYLVADSCPSVTTTTTSQTDETTTTETQEQEETTSTQAEGIPLFVSADDLNKLWSFFENNESKTVKTSDGGTCTISEAKEEENYIFTLSNCENTDVENGDYSISTDSNTDRILLTIPDGKTKVFVYADDTSACITEFCLYTNPEPTEQEISDAMQKVWIVYNDNEDDTQLVPEYCISFDSDGNVKAIDINSGKEGIIGTYTLDGNIIKYDPQDPEFDLLAVRIFKIAEVNGATYLGAHEFFKDDKELKAYKLSDSCPVVE